MGNSVKIACSCCKTSPPALAKKYDVPETNMLGQGTFAKVYKGMNRKTKQDVAVKCIDKANTRRDLLNTEIWILQNLCNHPNIVNCFDMYETEDEVQLVMEIMLGGELFDLLDEHGPYGETEAAKYLLSIASGLAYLHRGNVVHRDLKPENLLLTKKGSAGVLKISDFGLAKILTPQDDNIMKVACGTWIYCAPEVLRLKKEKQGHYDNKCDIFSVGCILFIIMGGFHPFDYDGNDDEELMEECILADTWDFEDPAWHGVSRTAKELLEQMLHQDPRERMSAAELRDHPWTVGKVPKDNIDIVLKKTGLQSVAENQQLRCPPIITVSGPGESPVKPLLDAPRTQATPGSKGGDLDLDEPTLVLPTMLQPPRRPSLTSKDSRASGGKKFFPAAVAFEERRASGELRKMPKKDRLLHAGDKTETPDMFFKARGAPAVNMTKKVADNEARWDKFNKSSANKEKVREREHVHTHEGHVDKHGAARGAAKATGTHHNLKSYESSPRHRDKTSPVKHRPVLHTQDTLPTPSPRSARTESARREISGGALYGSGPSNEMEPSEFIQMDSGDSARIQRIKSDRSAHVKKNPRLQKFATQQMAVRQFANVNEWKAKQAPKLLAKTMTMGTLQENLDSLKADNSLQPPNKGVKVVKKPKLRTENSGAHLGGGGNHPVGRAPRVSKTNSMRRASTPKGGRPTSPAQFNQEGALNRAATDPEQPMERLLPCD